MAFAQVDDLGGVDFVVQAFNEHVQLGQVDVVHVNVISPLELTHEGNVVGVGVGDDDIQGPVADEFLFQFQFSIGAHGAHPF